MSEKEFKSLSAREIKVVSADGNEMAFEGYLAVFGNIDSYGDVIEKGAFSRSINELKASEKTLFILENHGGWGMSSTDDTPLGFFESLSEDNYGLYVKGKLFSNDKGKNAYIMLKEAPKGSMGMSIGYRVRGMKWAGKIPGDKDDKGVVRYLTDIDLKEGSIVTFPANDKARITDVKSEALRKREFETILKNSGYSAKEAVKICSIASNYYVKNDSVQYDDSKLLEVCQALEATCNELKSLIGNKQSEPVATQAQEPVNTVEENAKQDDTSAEDSVKALQSMVDEMKLDRLSRALGQVKSVYKKA